MKLYIITIDEVYDLEIFDHKPLAFFSKKAAEKKMKEIIKKVKKEYKAHDYKIESSSEGVQAYRDGSYCDYHYSASISEVEVQGKPSFHLSVIFGEQASRYAANSGYKKTRKAMGNEEFDGSAWEYPFETEADRDQAIDILNTHDGWLGNYWEKRDAK